MGKYQDRGIVKWSPFDALTERKNSVEKLLEERKKIDKPILSEEMLEKLNQIVFEAYLNGYEVLIEYYDQGVIKSLYGFIKKLDDVSKSIILKSKEAILVEDIIRVQILDK